MTQRRALTPSEIATSSHGLSDPIARADFKIAKCLEGWEENPNPFYIWLALEICIDTKREMPAPILEYLKQCAKRMRSLQARKPEGLREILRWVLDFPGKDKPGPGNLLDPDLGRPETCFVLQFSTHVCRGVNPTKALHDACDEICDDAMSDPTLRNWVKKHYDLKKWPSTIDEWREIILRQYPGEELAIRLDAALRFNNLDVKTKSHQKVIPRNSRSEV